MTNIKDIYCIDINWINKEILRRVNDDEIWDKEEAITNEAKISLLVEISSLLKPIQPLIEDAQAVASVIGMNDKNTVEQHSAALSKYINTQQFDINGN